MIERITKLVTEYQDEMIAMGAWSGHTYAPGYLSEIEEEAKAILKEINNYDAKHAAFKLETDYDNLITKVYQADNLSFLEKSDIADCLNEMYLERLEVAIKVLHEYAQRRESTC